MASRRGTRAALALQAIPEDEEVAKSPAPGGAPAHVLELIQEIDRQVEERVAAIMSAAEDAILSLRQEYKKQLVKLPKKTREMTLEELERQNPNDATSAALAEIRERCAALAEAARAPPATAARATRTASKRAMSEAPTVLRTVRARRAPLAPPPKFDEAPPEAAARRGRGAAAAGTSRRGTSAAAPPTFNGLPLATPMPFAGEAVPLPVTLLTQRRGGGRGAALAGPPPPDAAVITTRDGQQWALGKEGVAAIPETHRAEVTELLAAQFEFLAAALGKTVFARGGGGGGGRRR